MSANSVEKKARLDEDPAVSRFREYLRIKTIQPDPDYETAIKFLEGQAKEIGLSYQCIQVAAERHIVLMTWEGKDPTLSSLMLNSHMDVVPVYPDKWTCDPFEAIKRDNGDIVARGSQDMKCVGMQYLEAIRLLKATGFQPLRSIHVTFVPDEEIGGKLGMKLFVKTENFKALNVGFALDEGIANPTDIFTVFYAERTILWCKVTCFGRTGHACHFVEGTAAEKLLKIMNKLMAFRDKERKRSIYNVGKPHYNEHNRLMEDESLKLGDVCTLNMTVLNGGVQPNVVPSDLSAIFDIRVTPTQSIKELEEMLLGWFKEAAGNDFEVEWPYKNDHTQLTSIDESSNPWWKTFKTTCESLGMKLETEIFPAGTDSRYLREMGLPVLGFSPMNHTPILLHEHDEYLNESTFIRGIEIYEKLISELCKVLI